MTSETMTSKERVAAALALEVPDRTPIGPEMWYGAEAVLGDCDPVELAYADASTMLDAQLKVFDEYGGWDLIHVLPIANDIWPTLGTDMAPPTPESPIWQVLEHENMPYEDYDLVAEVGWKRYVKEVLAPRVGGWDDARYDKAKADDDAMYERAVPEYERRGARIFCRSWPIHPFFGFSIARSMLKFTEDLYYRPQKLHAALQKCTEEFIESAIADEKKYKYGSANITEERASAFFYPLRIFEEFWWPYTRQIVDALWAEGITLQFHLDTPWDKNLHYFKQLPKGSVGFHLDGTTDIFAAKELMRGHAWFIGDVSASLFALASPEEVERYVKRLIDEVGADGGFILGSGCCVPNKVKPENFRAFLETGRTYRPRKRR